MDTELKKYPYFVYPMISRLRENPDSPDAEALKTLIAANVGDPEALIALIGSKDADLRDFYPDNKAVNLSTEDTIDTFISRFGGSAALPADSPLEDIKAEEKKVKAEKVTAETIEVKAEEKKVRAEKVAAETLDVKAEEEDPLEKVKKLVKKKDYERALQIMDYIYLNNPKKSVYFADQIRFIRKMMLNDSKNKR